MWKCFSRTFKESLERRPCISRPDTTGQDSNHPCIFQTLTQSYVDNRSEGYDPDNYTGLGSGSWSSPNRSWEVGIPCRRYQKRNHEDRAAVSASSTKESDHYIAVDKNGAVAFVNPPIHRECQRRNFHGINKNTGKPEAHKKHDHCWFKHLGWGNGFSISNQHKEKGCQSTKHHDQNHERSWGSGPHIDPKHSWIGAVGWNGALASVNPPTHRQCQRRNYHGINENTGETEAHKKHDHCWLKHIGWGNGFSISNQHKEKGCQWTKHHDQNHERSWGSGPHFDPKHSWIGAVGWSGVLVLGWYMIQPLCHLRILPGGDKDKKYQASFEAGYLSLLSVLSKTVLAQPLAKSILPNQTQTPAVDTLLKNIEVTYDECDSSTILQAEAESLPFGPPTAEEALDEAAENFVRVQNSVVGSIDNRVGVEYMKLGKHKQAVVYFTKAMKLEDGPATYNLGLCCEMGLGTKQDFKQAAKYYQVASDLGHTTAMYNLGVFYVHGWGGLPVDCHRAQELFEKASQMGQMDAKKALGMVNSPSESQSHKSLPESLTPTEVFLQALGKVQSAPTTETITIGKISQENICKDNLKSMQDDFKSDMTLNESSKYDKKDFSQLLQDTVLKYRGMMQTY